ncbi:MAG: nitrilase family protein [Bacteroidetes bacterium]|nr:MAG: nitrilase family protein [Bacteroidota bacterium]
MENLNITIVQTSLFWEDRPANLAHFRELLNEIDEPTDLILLPEMFNTGFSINPEFCAEPMDGPSMLFLKEMAREKRVAITATLLVMEDGEYVNRLVFYYPDGRYLTYDKRHLFRLCDEARIFRSGEQRVIIPWKGWKLMPIICYDLRFPVWSKNRIVDGMYEYDLLFNLANWPIVRSYAWKVLLVARAIDNLAYVAGVNRVGVDGNGMDHTGDSMVVDHTGNVLFQAPAGEEEIRTITLDYEEMRLFRESFAFGLDWDTFTIH